MYALKSILVTCRKGDVIEVTKSPGVIKPETLEEADWALAHLLVLLNAAQMEAGLRADWGPACWT